MGGKTAAQKQEAQMDEMLNMSIELKMQAKQMER